MIEQVKDDNVVKLVAKFGYEEAAKMLQMPVPEVQDYINRLTARHSPEFFDNAFLKIQNKAGELVTLKDNAVQAKIQGAIDRQIAEGRPVRIKIPKARRHGVSTKVQAIFYRDHIYQKHLNFLTVCHDLESSGNMRAMFERYDANFPSAWRPATTKTTPKTWKFKKTDSSYLIDTASELDTGRSFTIHRLHLSEVAFYKDPDTLMTGLLRSVDKNPNTMIIAESTANGLGGWWYEFVTRDNDYELLFFPWYEDPGNTERFKNEIQRAEFERTLSVIEKTLLDDFKLSMEQLHWRRNEIENGFNGVEDMFRQEYPSTLEESFLTSGRPYFSATIVRNNLVSAKKKSPAKGFLEMEKDGKVSFIHDRHGLWTVTEEPQEGYHYRYVTGSDCAEGKMVNETKKEPDNSACTVFDRLTHKEVAQYCGVIDTDIFAHEIYKASRWYGSACDCIERNSAGIAVIDGLKHKDDIFLYKRELLGKDEEKETVEFGFQTNVASRDSLLSELRTRVRQGVFLSDNLETWVEFSTFVYDEKGKAQGQVGCKDDRVFASALACEAEMQANEMTPIERPVEKRVKIPDGYYSFGFEEESNSVYAEF